MTYMLANLELLYSSSPLPEQNSSDALDELTQVNTPPPEFPGILYIEARLSNGVYNKDEVCNTLREVALRWGAIELHKDLTLDDIYKNDIPEYVLALRATEYDHPDPVSRAVRIKAKEIRLNVYQFKKQAEYLKIGEERQIGEIIDMPCESLHNVWERTVIDRTIKTSLTRLATNLLAFSRKRSPNRVSKVNSVILAYGPPGSGKTSLCLGLVQTLSIRLNKVYPQTRLIQLNGCSLFSKFFGESSQLVTRVFQTLQDMCQKSEDTFVCILIDEVESIANCRTKSSAKNELMDSIRATNALLTGIDHIGRLPNVLCLCTSNLVDSLDAAFLSRCSLKLHIEAPSLVARYEILRASVNDLIDDGIIDFPHKVVPFHYLVLEPENSPSQRVHRIAGSLNEELGSGRKLGELSELALAVQVQPESKTCNLNDALSIIESFVRDQQNSNGKRKFDDMNA